MAKSAQSSEYTLHLIGHGHIDPVWLWRWQEGCEEVRATFRSALDRMTETPEFTFTASSAAFYAWVAAIDPPMLDEIAARVREGRWELAGGWWIEPDCNIPNGESIARQGLYGQQFFREHFGRQAVAGFNPDSFGHPSTFPQFLQQMGLTSYTYQRPAPDIEMRYAHTTFWWQAPDGSRVLACCLPESYNCGVDEMREKIRRAPAARYLLPSQRDVFCFYGVGNHGGGPTQAAIREILAAQKDSTGPQVRFSTLADYFRAIRDRVPATEIPTIAHDLQYHARGCYAVMSEIKRLNRRGEHTLMQAERWATVAHLVLGDAYPRTALRDAWETLLFHQFHDILAGSSISAAYQDARDALGHVCWTGDGCTNTALQRLARQIPTAGPGRATSPGRAVVVWNPLPWPVRRVVTATPSVQRGFEGPIRFQDHRGRAVPSQQVPGDQVESRAYTFLAEVPGLGYAVYRAVEARPSTRSAKAGTVLAEPTLLENRFWRLELDPHTGELTRLLDKGWKVEVLRRGLSLVVMVDHSDTWSHGLHEWRVEDGRFRLQNARVWQQGDTHATLLLDLAFQQSTCQALLTLYRDVPDIDLELRVHWREHYRVLKLAFETNLEHTTATCETPYGFAERPIRGEEQPGQGWMDLGGTLSDVAGKSLPYGFALLNDSKYSFDARRDTLRLTLLRSPVYAHHDNARVDASEPYHYMDQGEQTVRVGLVPHPGGWRDAGLPRLAWSFNEPLVVLQESGHKGTLGLVETLLSVEPANILGTVLKCAEDSDDLILRLVETHGRKTVAHVALPHFQRVFKVPIGPYQIKTVQLTRGKTWKAISVNLLEE